MFVTGQLFRSPLDPVASGDLNYEAGNRSGVTIQTGASSDRGRPKGLEARQLGRTDEVVVPTGDALYVVNRDVCVVRNAGDEPLILTEMLVIYPPREGGRVGFDSGGRHTRLSRLAEPLPR